jgi:hypothetical protein
LTFNKATAISKVQLPRWSNGLFGPSAESGAFTAGARAFTPGTNDASGLFVTTFTTPGASGTMFKLQANGQSHFRLAGLDETAAARPEPGNHALMALGLTGVAALAGRRQA